VVGSIGSGRIRGRGLGCAVSYSHMAQWGLYVRPPNGLGSWERLRGGLTSSAGPDVMQHDAYPREPRDHQGGEEKVWNHDIAPLHSGVRGALYQVSGVGQLSLGRHRARCLTVRLPMVAIGRALQPFPRSKRSRHVSAHSAFQLGLSTLEGRIRRCRRRGAPASEDCHLPSSLPPLASLLTGLP